ncbi:MAG: 4-(cytidine 5'-diphospho)-2-C-methyl-D-erythritol kinase [Candidatus Melainabacteria bacterium]|nr:4-(cytidine 5'-diphospho)-2-C-methyl-D-erythritol kinase [Candidatus Melainabacteria bacterium]
MPSILAPAKLNLFLSLHGLRPDGYHAIETVVAALRWGDTLHGEAWNTGSDLQFEWTAAQTMTPNPNDNLVVRAYHTFWQHLQQPPQLGLTGFKVLLIKHIPTQAGLGGGSSNAAAMLSLMADHYQSITGTAVAFRVLQAMAESLGSDVPFFLHYQRHGVRLALCQGRGERVTPLAQPAAGTIAMGQQPLVIVKPKSVAVSTPAAYQLIRDGNRSSYRSSQPLQHALQNVGCTKALQTLFHNDFEPVVLPSHPALQQVAKTLESIGVRRPLLCGSGAAMAGWLDPSDNLSARSLETHFPAAGFDCTETQLALE